MAKPCGCGGKTTQRTEADTVKIDQLQAARDAYRAKMAELEQAQPEPVK